ncbi:MAG TPA: LysM peptidoglycan-binding domain-containing protein [Clostridia bacterium]|nr:LysM peptidoglycan-binding domain-containing protein [Clostridia bacterium]
MFSDYFSREISEWPIFSGNNSNTFSTPDVFPANMIRNSSYFTNASATIAVSNGTIYAAGKVQSNTVFALDLKSGNQKWRFLTSSANDVINSIIAVSGRVYLLTSSGITSLTDSMTIPTVNWVKKDNAAGFNYDASRIFYTVPGANSQPSLVILDASNGTELNRLLLGRSSDKIGSIAVGGGKLYFTVWNDTSNPLLQLYSLDPTAGRIQWIAGLGSYAVPSSHLPIYSDGKVYLDYEPLGSNNVRQYIIGAFDALTGKRIWTYNTGTGLGYSDILNQFAVSSDSVIAVNNAGYMLSINKDTGALRWSVRFADIGAQGALTQSSGVLIAANNTIIFNNNSKIKIFDSTSGALLSAFNNNNLDTYPVAAAEKTLTAITTKGLTTFVPYVQGTASDKPFVGIQSINPSRISPYEAGYSQTTIRIMLSENESVQMKVINSSGQTVRNYPAANLSSGTGYRFWDARDDLGKPVPYGKYHFAFILKDLSGDNAFYEYPSAAVTVGNIIAVALSDVPLRSGPGIQYSIIRTIPTGANLYILGESGNWLRVSYLSGTPGYVTGYVPAGAMSVYSNPVLVTVAVPVNYTVKSGDTVYTIAAKFGTTMQLIVKYNMLTNPGSLTPGQRLVIPTLVKQPVKVIHVVVQGDSIWKISNYYNVVPELIAMNNKVDSNNLKVGQKLLIK